ncbi:Uclacyanin [Thalictrum thalictroides]|uniref:Uclacyanin n=1 Tax=Thalictrum thalictroides TaxID=46969 RepID=A0A7J6VP58_THATH|nr:Uclacyanin [Thalictrum thalictroides]
MFSVYRVFLVLFVTLAAAASEVFATKHEVTWDVSTDFKSWESGRTFKVGDQLEFKYSSSMHSVLELSGEKEYKSCDTGTSVNSMNGGNDVVKLTKPGTRYFACGTMGHCDQGMKLKIKTVAANGAGSSADSPSSSSTSPTSEEDTPSSSSTASSTTPTSAAQATQFLAAMSLALTSIIIGLLNIFV